MITSLLPRLLELANSPLGRLLAWLVVLAVIFVPLEYFFAVRRSRPSPATLRHDLFYYFLSSLLPALLLSVPLGLVAAWGRALLPAAVPAALAALPLAARLLLVFVVGELGFYWGHRLTHKLPLLWRFHAVHHSPEHLYFLVNTRAHPVDLVFVRLCGMVPLYMLGLAGPGVQGSVMAAGVIVLGTLWGFFIHSNVRLRLGWFEWLLSTPAFHHWHHTRHAHVDRNFASMLPVLDKIFGTFYLPPEWPQQYGIATPLAPTLVGQLVHPLPPSPEQIVINKT